MRENDPVYKCDLYKDQGCSHVDGFLCDYPDCEMNRKYKIEKKCNAIIKLIKEANTPNS